MATSAFFKINGFVEHKNHGVHQLGAHQLRLALSNTPPASESPDPSVLTVNAVIANVTEVDASNLTGGVSDLNITRTSSAQVAGTYKLALQDLPLVAAGGSVGPFRYVYIVNDTPSSPLDPLMGYFDYGQSITLGDGETLVVDFSEANGVLTDS